MKTSKLILLSAVSALAVVAAAFAQDAVNIVWKPMAGQRTRYWITMSGQASKFTNTLTLTVKEIQADGKIVMTSKSYGIRLTIAGQDMSAMIPHMDATTVIMPNGELVSRTPDKPSEFYLPRLWNALVFIYPEKSVKAGDTWTRSYAGDEKTSVPASTTTFTYLGVEKTEGGPSAHKIQFDFKESGAEPITGTGTAWVDVNGGYMLNTEFSLQNLVLMEGRPPTDMKGTIFRIKSTMGIFDIIDG